MVDHLKFVIPTKKYQKNFEGKVKYHFNQRFDNNTGELKYPIWGECDGMKVKITTKVIEISGSLHKYWNLKQYRIHANYNDFNRHEIKQALELLAREFSFDLEDAILSSLEFGVNLEVNSDPVTIIQKNILTYKERVPKINDDYMGTGKFTQFDFSNYRFKIYDKGKQFNLDYRLLRVELKTKKSVHVTGKGVKWNLTKLYDRKTLHYLGDMLLSAWDELLMCDTVQLVDVVDNSDYQKLLEFSNPRNWVYWKSTLSNKTKNRRKEVFKALREKYSLNVTQSELRELLSSKISEVLL